MPVRWSLAVVGLLCALSTSVLSAPAITWGSDPVGPDETVMLLGGGFTESAVAEVARLHDGPAGTPAVRAPNVDAWETLPLLQRSPHDAKFVLPADREPGVYACRVRDGGAVSAVRLLNAPDVWWLQGDGGSSASPGGWVRIFGKCLSFTRPAQVVLVSADGVARALVPAQGECWSLNVAIPADAGPGEYTVWVHNGLGGEAAWTSAGKLQVAPAATWKTEVFNVRDFGTDVDKAVHDALAKVEQNGGGVVYFPRGRYGLKGELTLPPGTILRGEGMGLVSLYWPDMETPPNQLITGTRFGLEDLSIYCQNHKNVVMDQDGSDGTFLRRVRIRANCYFMIEDIGKEFRGRKGPPTHRACGAAVMLRGRNFEVADCDIYASNYALRVYKAKVGIVARNRLAYGGRGYSIENADRLIFEGNTVRGNNLLSIGNDITTFWTSYCRNIYYARNRVEQMYGADREMMTLDAGGGAYFGKLAEAQGARMTLAADPTYMDYQPKPHTDWTGGAFMILDGTGAGQWRQVTRNEGRDWELDRSWDIAPDETSVISIAPHRGRHLFIENSFEDGGAFQLYGAALDTIVAGNKGTRMDGFYAWGLNPHDWGWQPVWCCQFLDNQILEGNGYGPRSAFIGTLTGNNNDTYAGPLGRGLVFRRNICDSNARLRITGTVDGVVVENCTVRNNELGVDVRKPARNVLLRNNTFEAVTTPLGGDGVGDALVVPSPATAH